MSFRKDPAQTDVRSSYAVSYNVNLNIPPPPSSVVQDQAFSEGMTGFQTKDVETGDTEYQTKPKMLRMVVVMAAVMVRMVVNLRRSIPMMTLAKLRLLIKTLLLKKWTLVYSVLVMCQD